MAGIYETFYKLTTDPFRLSPDHRFSFGHPSYKKAKAYMQYALQRGEGFIMVTGSPGTGKTTLINDMLSQIDDKAITVVSLLSTRLQPDDMLHMVATSLGISCEGARKSTLLVKIKEALTHQHRAQRRVVLMVDEAQDLSEEVVEELRLLSNMQSGINLLLQVFLVGQEPLVKLVKKPDMEHLRQRIIAATHLDPLSIEDTAAFIVYRMKRAGWKGDPRITSSALESIYRFSGGVPRRINLICSRLLFFGAVEKKHTLEKADIDSVMQGMQEEMLFGEHQDRPEDDSIFQTSRQNHVVAQSVRGAGSFAYAVPEKALKEPDPSVPLARFFDVVDEQAEDLVLEVVPADLDLSDPPELRIDPPVPDDFPESLPGVQPIAISGDSLSLDRITTDVAADEDTDLSRHDSDESTSLREERVERPVGKRSATETRKAGWGSYVLLLVFIVVVLSTAFFAYKHQDFERLAIYEQLTAWLEKQGISFVLPLKDPNEPGTRPKDINESEGTGRFQTDTPGVETTGNTDPQSETSVEQSDRVRAGMGFTAGELAEHRTDVPPVEDEVDVQSVVEEDINSLTPDSAQPVQTQSGRVDGIQSAESPDYDPGSAGLAVEQQPADDADQAGTDTTLVEQSGSDEQASVTGAVVDVESSDNASPTVSTGESGDTEFEAESQPVSTEQQTGQRIETQTEKDEDVEVASFVTRRTVPDTPLSELAVLKSGPRSIPGSIPSAYRSREEQDYDLVEIRSRLKKGEWGAFGEPAALLPSTMNHCKDEGVRITCWTAPQEHVSNGRSGVYQIESAMDGFSSRGTFEVRYKILETSIRPGRQNEGSASRVEVKPGWAMSEHQTLCWIVHERLIRCYGGEEGVFSYTSLR